MIKIIFFIISIILFFSGCTNKNQLLFSDVNSTVKPNKNIINKHTINYTYKIHSGDIVSVMIFNHPELMNVGNNQNALSHLVVDKEGYIFLPLINRVKIAGLSEEEATNKLIKKYSLYLKRPYIQLKIVSKKVYVLGEVKKPGVIYLNKDYTTLIDVISKSGGFTDMAKRNKIKIISLNSKPPVVKIIDLSKINNVELSNLIIKPNEIVYVEPMKAKLVDTNIKGIKPVVDLVNGILNSVVDIKVLSK